LTAESVLQFKVTVLHQEGKYVGN